MPPNCCFRDLRRTYGLPFIAKEPVVNSAPSVLALWTLSVLLYTIFICLVGFYVGSGGFPPCFCLASRFVICLVSFLHGQWCFVLCLSQWSLVWSIPFSAAYPRAVYRGYALIFHRKSWEIYILHRISSGPHDIFTWRCLWNYGFPWYKYRYTYMHMHTCTQKLYIRWLTYSYHQTELVYWSNK